MGPHFLASGLEIRDHSVAGRGAFATRPFSTGELLVMWGGWIISTSELYRLSNKERTFAVQVEEDLFLVTPRAKVGSADFINHSCDPNAGLSGAIGLVALRPILPGDEVCYDYAMTDSHPDLGFECRCGAANCRGKVSGEDWRLPELQSSYDGFFSPYLQRRIQAERVSGGAQAGEDVLAHLHRGLPNLVTPGSKLVAVQR